jgi:hypothetical protein
MSKGISWRQRLMLHKLLNLETRFAPKSEPKPKPEPVAWRDIDYGPTSAEGEGDYFSARNKWNIEQAQRRALRNLEQRGLVVLGRYVFQPEPVIEGFGWANIAWTYVRQEHHVPGESRIMTGVLLTEAGRQIALAEEAKLEAHRAATAIAPPLRVE